MADKRTKRLQSSDSWDLSQLPTNYETWDRDYPDYVWGNDLVRHDNSHESTHLMCYLCNAIVPIAYVSEHVNSSKHVAYQRIAKMGLERARKHAQMIGIETMKGTSEYFCEHCVRVVNVSNQKEHEISKAHKHSAALDKLVNKFALFYTTDLADIIDIQIDETDDSNEDYSLLKIQREFEDIQLAFYVTPLTINDVQAIPDNSALDNKLGESKSLIPMESRLDTRKEMNSDEGSRSDTFKEINNYEKSRSDTFKEINNNEEPRLDTHKEMNKNEESRSDAHKEMNNNLVHKYVDTDSLHNIDDYIKRLKVYGKVKVYTLNSFTGLSVKIEAEDGSELLVSTLKFDGIMRVGRIFHCRICNTSVKNVGTHRVLEEHITVVAQPLQNKHCIRPLRERLSHCVLCNQNIGNVDLHIQQKYHLKKLERALVLVNQIPSLNNVAVKPADSEEIVAESPKTEKISVNMNSDPKANETAVKIPVKQYYCLPCDIYMPFQNLEQHLTSSQHLANAETLISYCMIRTTEDKLTCKVCQTNVYNFSGSVEDHLATFIHINSYNDYLATNEIIKTENKFFCKPCGMKILKMRELSHVENQSHKVRLAYYNNKNNITKTNTIKSVVDAVEGKVSNKNVVGELNAVNKSIAKPNNTFIPRNQNNEDTSNVNNPKTTDYDRKAFGVQSPFYCNVCNEYLIGIYDTLHSHNKKFKHRNNSLVINDNKIFMNNKNCYCEVCDDTFTRDALEDHVNSVSHDMFLDNYQYQRKKDGSNVKKEAVFRKGYIWPRKAVEVKPSGIYF